MRKLRCDALWNTYTPEQKQKLEEWLIEKNIGIRQVQRLAKKELGIDCGKSTIGRIYQYLIKFKAADEVSEAQSAAEELLNSGAKPDQVRDSSMTMISVRLLQKAMSDKASVKDLATLGRVILQSQERQIQEKRVDLARERFQFKAAQAALEVLPMAGQLKKEDMERERARMEAVRRQLFRKELDHIIERTPAAVPACPTSSHVVP